MTRRTRASVSVVTLVLAACGGNEPPSDTGLVARAANQTWTIDEAVTLIAPDSTLPADPEAVRAIANLWIDYTLLATAVSRDSSLAQIDMSPVVNDLAQEQMLAALRDSVIRVEPLTDQQLRERYQADAPGSLLRARQILMTWPQDATEAQRDSVRRAIEAVRARIVDGGEDFGTVAEEVSQTPGGLPGGWDLGIVRRGQLEAAVDSALFSLATDAVSDPVTSPYGVHLLQVQERLTPSPEQFRAELLDRRAAAAESVYVAQLEAQAEPEILEGAAERVRTMARNWRSPLPEREETRPLLRYAGGSVTQGEVLWYLQSQAPVVRQRVAASRDDKIADDLLEIIANRELLLADALRRGWSSPVELRERVAGSARRNLGDAARQLGLFGYPVAPDTDPAEAVREAVNKLLSDILTGARREVTPLGVMSYVLRRRFPAHVVDEGIAEVVDGVRAARTGAFGPQGGA